MADLQDSGRESDRHNVDIQATIHEAPDNLKNNNNNNATNNDTTSQASHTSTKSTQSRHKKSKPSFTIRRSDIPKQKLKDGEHISPSPENKIRRVCLFH